MPPLVKSGVLPIATVLPESYVRLRDPALTWAEI